MSDYEIKEWLNQKSRIAKLEAAIATANKADVIPRSSLPALPANLKPPFVATGSIVGDRYSMILTAIDPTEATFLAALLNAVYGGGEGKS